MTDRVRQIRKYLIFEKILFRKKTIALQASQSLYRSYVVIHKNAGELGTFMLFWCVCVCVCVCRRGGGGGGGGGGGWG